MFTLFVLIIIGVLGYMGYIKKQQYDNFMKLKSDDTSAFRRIKLSSSMENGQDIGHDTEHSVHFMARDDNSRISFPESKFGNKKYYIVEVSFDPDVRIKQTIQGRTGSVLVGNFIAGPLGAIVGSARKKKIKSSTSEKKTDCYVTMIDESLQEAFSIVLIGNTKDYNDLIHNYKLSNIELDKITEKFQQVEEQVQKVNDDSNKNVNERLENLKKLHEQELITDQEYSDKKKQILNI